MELLLFDEATGGKPQVLPMQRNEYGVWLAQVSCYLFVVSSSRLRCQATLGAAFQTQQIMVSRAEEHAFAVSPCNGVSMHSRRMSCTGLCSSTCDSSVPTFSLLMLLFSDKTP